MFKRPVWAYMCDRWVAYALRVARYASNHPPALNRKLSEIPFALAFHFVNTSTANFSTHCKEGRVSTTGRLRNINVAFERFVANTIMAVHWLNDLLVPVHCPSKYYWDTDWSLKYWSCALQAWATLLALRKSSVSHMFLSYGKRSTGNNARTYTRKSRDVWIWMKHLLCHITVERLYDIYSLTCTLPIESVTSSGTHLMITRHTLPRWPCNSIRG
jgi:hypothetical protein